MMKIRLINQHQITARSLVVVAETDSKFARIPVFVPRQLGLWFNIHLFQDLPL